MSFLLAPQVAPFVALGGAYVYGNHKIDQWEAADTAARIKAATWYHSPAEMYQSNPSYQRQANRLIRGARKPDLVIDASGPVKSNGVVTPAASTGVPLTQVTDPARYFTDKLLRDPVTPGWWSHLKNTAIHNPVDLVRVALETVVGGAKWIGWNYLDLIDQWKSWDGTVGGFLTNSELIWRTVVSVGLTTGLILSAPLMDALRIWTSLFLQLVRDVWSVGEMVLGELKALVEGIVTSVSRLL